MKRLNPFPRVQRLQSRSRRINIGHTQSRVEQVALRFFHAAAGAGVLLIAAYSSQAVEPEFRRPNILYIFCDDLSMRSVSCYPEAYDWVKTPNLDRLAAEGIRFSACYVGAWCMPSRATALTGKLPHGIESLRVTKNPRSEYDPEKCRFWPSSFRQAGYHTAMIGKWHLGSDTGHGRDWDHSIIWNHSLPEEFGHYYLHQKLSFDGRSPEAVEGYSTDNYTRWACDYISRRAQTRDQPWFLWLCYDAVHAPYTAAERHRGEYQKNPRVPDPPDLYPPRPDKPPYMRDYGVWRRNAEGEPASRSRTLTEAVRQYNRTVLALDEGVGKVLAALAASDQLENTAVVFASDQGFAWGQHGFEWKYAPYDANLRAPLLIRFPKRITPGSTCRHAVGGQDLIPTFFALARIPLPWAMHGRDLSPLLDRPASAWEEPVLLENTKWYFGSDTDRAHGERWNGVPWWVFLRQGRYKYIRTIDIKPFEELYDLESDPEELRNLALESDYRETVQTYRESLLRELERTGAGMATVLRSNTR
jgi:arylsulfatase A-like enzyme